MGSSVLVVEDDADVRDLLVEALTGEGASWFAPPRTLARRGP